MSINVPTNSRFLALFVCLLLFIWTYAFFRLFSGNDHLEDAYELEQQQLKKELDQLKLMMKYGKEHMQALKKSLKDHEDEENRVLSKLKHPKAVTNHRIWKEPIPVLVFACNRAHAVDQHIRKLLKYRPSKQQFPIIVSQDCDDQDVRNTVEGFGDEVQYIKHLSGNKANITVPNEHRMYSAYYRIARHYKLALSHVFDQLGHSFVIITEDDLDIAPDFFEYFSATRYLLSEDPRLWCVSAWNDNGKSNNIDIMANDLLYRSDFFSGLGWMMTSKLWNEFAPIWPNGFWDDWMRDPLRRKGRQCIRPEISRTGMSPDGKIGASKGQFFSKHLAKVVVNSNPYKFTQHNLDYLLEDNYLPWFRKEIESSPLKSVDDLIQMTLDKKRNLSIKSVRVEYTGNIDYIQKADRLSIMHDFKAGVPRTAYEGTVTCSINGLRIYLVPHSSVKWYDPTWEVPPSYGD